MSQPNIKSIQPSIGIFGENATINGSGFTNISNGSVIFTNTTIDNGVASTSVTFVSDSAINVVIPTESPALQPGAVSVIITIPTEPVSNSFPYTLQEQD